MSRVSRRAFAIFTFVCCVLVAGCAATNEPEASAPEGFSQVTGWWSACQGCGQGPWVLYYKGTEGVMSFNGSKSPCAGDKIPTTITLSADGKTRHIVAYGCGDRFEGDLVVGGSYSDLGSIFKVSVSGLKWGR
jgi:hypothetical protein